MNNTMRAIEDGRTINRIMAVNRFVVLVAAFLFIYLTSLLNIVRFDALIALIYVLPAIAVINGIWLRYSTTQELKRFYFLLQVLIDTGLILAGIYFSGKLYSDFLFLPLIVLSLAALVSWRLSLLAFALSLGFYLYLFFNQIWGLPFQEALVSLGGLNGMKFIRILIFSFMAILISFVISYFIKEIKKRNEEIERIKKAAYTKTVFNLCDLLTAIRWTTDKLNDYKSLYPEFFSPEVVKNLEIFRQFNEEILSRVKKSTEMVNSDFIDNKL